MSHVLEQSLTQLSLAALIERIGWLLVHSVWQFAALALLSMLVESVLRRASARTRYVTLLAALLMIVVAPLITWSLLQSTGTVHPSVASHAVSVDSERETGQPSLSGVVAEMSLVDVDPAVLPLPENRVIPLPNLPQVAIDSTEPPLVRSWFAMLADVLHPWLAEIVGLWSLGVLVFSIRPMWGWWVVRRLRLSGVSSVTATVEQAFQRMCTRLKISQRVSVLQSSLVRVPVVVGCFRSVILLPASFIAGVPVSHLEAILAHELAHVRRYDYLVNLLQTLVETLFFYHPAVWWLSHRIRVERENCCDDLVVEALGNRVEYGRALLAVEQFRSESLGSLALGANDGSLLSRVKRLFASPPGETQRGSAGWMAIAGLSTGLLLIAIWVATLATADEKPPQASLVTPQESESVPSEPQLVEKQKADAEFKDVKYGEPSRGLRIRVVPVPSSMDETEVDLAQATTKFATLDDVAFAVEIVNASEKPVALRELRYGGNYGDSKGKLASDWFGQFLFSIDYFDAAGERVERPELIPIRNELDIAERGALQTTLEPQQSVKMLLRPNRWISALSQQPLIGTQRAVVRYRGSVAGDGENVLNEVVSPAVEFAVTRRGYRPVGADAPQIGDDPKNDPQLEADLTKQLVWGESVNGLRAALDVVPVGPFQSLSHGTKPKLKLVVQNVSDQVITLASLMWLSELPVQAKNAQDENVAIQTTWYTGDTPVVRVRLKPQQVVTFDAGNLGLAVTKERAQSFEDVTHRRLIAPQGKYTLQATERFGTSFTLKDGQGNVLVPAEGDFKGQLTTGLATIDISNEIVEGRLVDAVTGQPVEGTTVNFIVVKPKTPDTDELTLAHMVWGPKSPAQIYFSIPAFPEDIAQRPDRDELVVLWGVGSHPDYEDYGPADAIPLKEFFHEGPKTAREVLSRIKLIPKKAVSTAPGAAIDDAKDNDVTSQTDFAKELVPFQGNWAMDLCDSEIEEFGAAQDVVRNWRWSIQGNEIRWTRSNGEIWKLTFTVNPTKSPKEIDFTFVDGPHKGETCRGMYDWGGINQQMLLMSMQDPGAKVARPKSISMTGGGQTSLIFLQPVGPDEAEKERAALQGTWQFEIIQTDNWPKPMGKGPDREGQGDDRRWVIKGNEITWFNPAGEEVKLTYTIDPAKAPKQIDMTFLNGPHQGQKCLGMYERGGKNSAILWLCLTDPGTKIPRPTKVSYEFGAGRTMIGLSPMTTLEPVSANGEIVGVLVDERGQPVRGAVVACGAIYREDGKDGGTRATTDVEGRYRLLVPSPGIYTVFLKSFESDPKMTAAADDGLKVEAGRVTKSTLRLIAGREIVGQVVDENGSPFAGLTVMCYSAARPQSMSGVQSTPSDKDGFFKFYLAPGAARIYATETVEQTQENPFGIGRTGSLELTVPPDKDVFRQTLTLGRKPSRFGSNDWLKRSTPGTQIVSHEDKADVTGIVVDEAEKPLAKVKVIKINDAPVTTNLDGRFQVPCDKGTQFVMHAFSHGYRVWFGTPTAGDDLKIVLEKKSILAVADQPKAEPDQSAVNNKIPDFVVSVRVKESETRKASGGSGFIVTPSGEILTCSHLIGSGKNPPGDVRIGLPNGQEFVARVLANDPRNDLALLKIDAPTPLPTATIDERAIVAIGDTVRACGQFGGQPLNLVGSVTGLDWDVIVSDVLRYRALIKTNAPFKIGISGGPMLDRQNRVVGIACAIRRGTSENLGFAIPLKTIQTFLTAHRQKQQDDSNNSNRSGDGLARPNPVQTLPDSLNVMSVGFDKAGKLWSVSTRSKMTLRSWDIATAEKLSELEIESEKHANHYLMGELQLSPDRSRVLSISDGNVIIWDSKSGNVLARLKPPNGQSAHRGLACSADLSRIACGLMQSGGRLSQDAQIAIWDVATGQLVRTVTHPRSVQIQSTALSPDGRWLATGSQEAGLCLWDLSSGDLKHHDLNENTDKKYPDPEVPLKSASQIVSLQFSPDGRRVAFCDLLGVKFLEVESGKLIHDLKHHFRWGRSGLVFSSDGRWLARVGTDKTIPLWNTQTGQLFAELPSVSNGGSFSTDNRWFAVGFSDESNGIRLWQLQAPVTEDQKQGAHTELPTSAIQRWQNAWRSFYASQPTLDAKKYVRNAVVDLTGAPASDEQINAFLADEAPDKPAKLINQLASTQAFLDFFQQMRDENEKYQLEQIGLPARLLRGPAARTRADVYRPIAGQPVNGLTLAVALRSRSNKFMVGDRIPLDVLFYNASNETLNRDFSFDFIAHPPRVVDEAGNEIAIEKVRLTGAIPLYRETLRADDFFIAPHVGLGLGENPTPGANWYPHTPPLKPGKYRLTQSWNQLTSGELEFEVVEAAKNPAGTSGIENTERPNPEATPAPTKVTVFSGDNALITAAELKLPDVQGVNDPAELLRQLDKGPRVSQVLITGSGLFWTPGAPPPPMFVESWTRQFAAAQQLDPRVKRLIELSGPARDTVHEQLPSTRPVVVGHLAVVLRSIGDEQSIPLLIHLLERLSKSDQQVVMETSELMATFAATSALWELTGQKHVFTPKQWLQWWEGVKEGYVVARQRKSTNRTEQELTAIARKLITELRQSELPARDRLIAVGPAVVPYLLVALKEESTAGPLAKTTPESPRLMSLKLAWVVDELDATEKLPTEVRRLYFTSRMADAWLRPIAEPADQLALCRALSHCPFADFCRILMDAERLNEVADPRLPAVIPLWLHMNSMHFSRRFQAVPTYMTNPAQHPHWNDVTPAENPAQEIAEAVPVLAAALQDEKSIVRRRAANLAGIIGFCSKERPDTLIVALRDCWLNESDDRTRSEIGSALARYSTPLVVKAFSEGLRSNRPEIVSESAGFLGSMDFTLTDQTRPAFELLAKLTHAEDPKLRARAVRTLSSKAPQLLIPEFERLAKDPNEDIRQTLSSLRINNVPKEYVEALFVLTGDTKESIRTEAISAIGRLGRPESMSRLRPLLNDKRVHGWAVAAIVDSGKQESLPILMEELKGGNEVGGMIYQHLKRLTGESFQNQPDPWLDWWKDQKADKRAGAIEKNDE